MDIVLNQPVKITLGGIADSTHVNHGIDTGIIFQPAEQFILIQIIGIAPMAQVLSLFRITEAIDNCNVVSTQHCIEVPGNHATNHAGATSYYDHAVKSKAVTPNRSANNEV